MAKRALCIGINNYPGTANDLSGCVNDARDWSAALESRGFGVNMLVDTEATKAGMVAAIQEVVRSARSGDTVVIQYSGHGSYVPDDDEDEEPDGRDEVLCPCDIAQNAYLTDDELYDLFAERQNGVKIIFLSDSCHSGTASKEAPARVPGGKITRSRFLSPATFLPREKLAAAVRIARSRSAGPRAHQGLLISGCQDNQTSADAWFDNRANGAFSYFALQALKGLAPGSTYSQWFKAIRQMLPSVEFSQRPNLYGTRSQKQWQDFA